MSLNYVVITRPDGDEFAKKIRAEGFETILVPLFSLAPIHDAHALALIQGEILNYQWLIFTSRHGVRFFAAELRNELPRNLTLAAIGSGTSIEMEKQLGRRADVCGGGESSEDFLKQIIPLIGSRDRVLLVTGTLRRGIVEGQLRDKGIHCDVIELYKQERAMVSHGIRQTLETIPCAQQLWTFFSPSAFSYACKEFPHLSAPGYLGKMFSIGKVTSAAIFNAGFPVTGEAKVQSEDGMIQAICDWRSSEA